MIEPVPQPSSLPQVQRFLPTPDAVQAVLAALVLRSGEPLVDPIRVVLSLSRPEIERAAGRPLQFEYVKDELNPFGRLDVVVRD